MANSQDSTLVEEEAFPGDWLDEEDRESVRLRHAESVERWLDQASFANELFKLHVKYGIEQGDEGYKAYRLYLQQQYEKMLLTNGPMVDPLGEGCDCLFCRFDHEEISFRPARDQAASAASTTETPAEETAQKEEACEECEPLVIKPPVGTEMKQPFRQRDSQSAVDDWSSRFQTADGPRVCYVRSGERDADARKKSTPRQKLPELQHRSPSLASGTCDRTAATCQRATSASRGPPVVDTGFK